MSKRKKSSEATKKELALEEKHPTAPPRLEGKVKNVGIKPLKKKKKVKR